MDTNLEQKFVEKLMNRKKNDLVRRFLTHVDKIEIFIFTAFSGQKQISPFRNIQCLQPQCVFDIDELVLKYRQSGYTNFMSFVCFYCGRLLDIQEFYRDYTFERMIDKIWVKYNKKNIILCNKILIYKSGQWEPVLPDSIKYLDKQMIVVENTNQKLSDSHIEEEDDIVPQEIEVYETTPMIEEFDGEELELLLQKTAGNEDSPTYENDIVLRRYQQQVKWGAILQLRNQSSFLQPIMIIFNSYIADYYRIKMLRISTNPSVAIALIKVNGFDLQRLKATFTFLYENFRSLRSPLQKYCKLALIIVWYDERWVLFSYRIRTHTLKVIDFIDPELSRVPQDELWNLGSFFFKQLFPSLQIKRPQTKDLNKYILEQQMAELHRKIQYYSDCGLHIALYVYCFIMQELKRGSQKISTNQPPFVENIDTEKDSFTQRICWLLLMLAQDQPKIVKCIQYQAQIVTEQPQYKKQVNTSIKKIQKTEEITLDSIDMILVSSKKEIQQDQQIVQKQSQTTIQNNKYPKDNKTNRSNNIQAPIRQTYKNWEQNPEDPPFQEQTISKINKESFQPSIDFSNRLITNQDSIRKNILEYSDKQSHININHNSRINSSYDKQNYNYLLGLTEMQEEEPYFSMPRNELISTMNKYKKEIIDGYQSQQIANFIGSKQQEQQNLQRQKINNGQRVTKNNLQSNSLSIYPNKDKQSQNLYEEREIRMLERELGLEPDEQLNFNISEYNQRQELNYKF